MTDRILKVADGLILSIITSVAVLPVLFPVYLYPWALSAYGTLIAAAGLLFVMSGKFLKEENRVETPVDNRLFMLFIWYIVSSLAAKNIFASVNSAVTFILLMLLYYVVFSYSSRFTRYITFVLVAVAAAAALYGTYQYFYGFRAAMPEAITNTGAEGMAVVERLRSGRIFSFFIYPNAFAGFLLLTIPVCAGLIKTERKLRPLFFAVLLLLSFSLFLTKSVSAFISLILGLIIMMFLVNDASLRAFRQLLLLLLLVATAVFALVLKTRGLSGVINNLITKLESYLRMFDTAKDYLLTGAGPGSFTAVYNTGGASYLKYAHSIFFQPLIETGLPGLLLLILIAAQGYGSFVRNFMFLRTQQKKVMALSFAAGVTAFLIHNLSDFSIYNFELSVAFTISAALLMAHVPMKLIETKRLKLSYLLGINPGKRRSIIFGIVLAVIVLGAVTGGKQLYIYTAITALIVAGFAVWSVSKEDIRRTAADIPLLLLFFWAIASAIKSPDQHSAALTFTLVCSALVLFYLTSQFLKRHEFRIIISDVLISLGAALSLTALGQYIFISATGKPGAADAFFPNPNLFASFLLAPFAASLSRILFEKKNSNLWLKISLLAAISAGIGISNSKGGLIAAGLIFFGTWYYYHRNKRSVKDTDAMQSRKNTLLRACLAILALGLFFSPSGRKLTSPDADPFYFNRLGIYRAAAGIAADNPVFGAGLGSFGSVFPRYNFPVDSLGRYQMETRFAHNEYLHAAAEAGFPALAFMALLVFGLLKRPPLYEGHRKTWASNTGFYFGLAGILFHSLFDFNLHCPGILFTAAVLSAFIVREYFTVRTVPREALLFTRVYYFPALLLSFILFTYVLRPAAAGVLLDDFRKNGRASALLSAIAVEPINPEPYFLYGRELLDRGDLKGAGNYFSAAVSFDRLDYIYLLHLARAQSRLGLLEKASEAYSLAIGAAPFRAFSYFEAANFDYMMLGDYASARLLLEKAVSIEPAYNAARNNLALLYESSGEYGPALEQYKEIENTLELELPVTDYERELFDMEDESVVYAGMGRIYLRLGRPAGACLYYKKALALSNKQSYRDELKSICGGENANDCCEN